MQGKDSDTSPSPWNIALLHPTFWPYVRRGTERFMAEWSTRLAQLGHNVTIITSKPGPSQRSLHGRVHVQYLRSLWTPSMARAGLHDFHVFPLTTAPLLASRRFHLIHTFNFTDTLVASWLKRFHGARVLLHLNTIPPPVQYRRTLSTGGKLLSAAIRAADQLLVISKQQQDYFEQRYHRPCVRIPAPVDVSQFPVSSPSRPAPPRLLCASALSDTRKGGSLLMRAFNLLKPSHPDLLLEIVFPLPDHLRLSLLNLVDPPFQRDVHFNPLHDTAALIDAYSRSSALVLPSLWEAFPLVVLESLAAGTPIVGTSDGGIPEMLGHPGAGVLFSPGEPLDGAPSNLSGLVDAIRQVLLLSTDALTPQRCRAAAEQFSWDRLTPAYTALYSNLIGDL